MFLELAYPGIHKGTELTSDELRQIADTFTGDTALISPKITITHEGVEEQKNLGKINKLYVDERGWLVGDVDLLDQDFAEDYEKGVYPNLSIGIKKADFDNEKLKGENLAYLHHIAFLSSTQPKIVGLNKKFSEDVRQIFINFADDRKEGESMDKDRKIADLEAKIKDMEQKEQDKIFAEVEKAKEENKELEKKFAEEAKKREELEGKLKEFAEKELANKKSTFKAALEGKFPKEAIDTYMEKVDKNFADTDTGALLELLNSIKPINTDLGGFSKGQETKPAKATF